MKIIDKYVGTLAIVIIILILILHPLYLRWSPDLEIKRIFRMTPIYRVHFDCNGEHENPFTSFFEAGNGHQFAADSNEDAIDFIKSVRPHCTVTSLYRMNYERRGGHFRWVVGERLQVPTQEL